MRITCGGCSDRGTYPVYLEEDMLHLHYRKGEEIVSVSVKVDALDYGSEAKLLAIWEEMKRSFKRETTVPDRPLSYP